MKEGGSADGGGGGALCGRVQKRLEAHGPLPRSVSQPLHKWRQTEEVVWQLRRRGRHDTRQTLARVAHPAALSLWKNTPVVRPQRKRHTGLSANVSSRFTACFTLN